MEMIGKILEIFAKLKSFAFAFPDIIQIIF